MKLDFGDILGRMWKIGWNHKVLWLWHIFPGLVSFALMPCMFLPLFITSQPDKYARYAESPWMLMGFFGLTMILLIPTLFMSVMAQLTTTYGAMKIEKGAESLVFRDLFSESLPYFWRVLGLYVIFGGAWMLLIMGWMFIMMLGTIATAGIAVICMTPLFMLFFPIAIVGYSVLELAQAAIIADDMGTLKAISRGWELFRANALAVTLLMVILYFALSMISSLFVFPMMLPMMFMPMAISAQGDLNSLMFGGFLIFFMVISLGMYVVQGILMAFFQSAWMVAYLRLGVDANPTTVNEG